MILILSISPWRKHLEIVHHSAHSYICVYLPFLRYCLNPLRGIEIITRTLEAEDGGGGGEEGGVDFDKLLAE